MARNVAGMMADAHAYLNHWTNSFLCNMLITITTFRSGTHVNIIDFGPKWCIMIRVTLRLIMPKITVNHMCFEYKEASYIGHNVGKRN